MSDNSRKWTREEHEAFDEVTREMFEIERLTADILRRLNRAASLCIIFHSQFSQGPPVSDSYNHFRVPEGAPPLLLQVGQSVAALLFQILIMLEQSHLLDTPEPQCAEPPPQRHSLAPPNWKNAARGFDIVPTQQEGYPSSPQAQRSAIPMVQLPHMPSVHARPLHQYQPEQALRIPSVRSVSWQNFLQAHCVPSENAASQFGFNENSQYQEQIRTPYLFPSHIVRFPSESYAYGQHQQPADVSQTQHQASQVVAFRSKSRANPQSQYQTSQNGTPLSECNETAQQHQPVDAQQIPRGRPASRVSIRAPEPTANPQTQYQASHDVAKPGLRQVAQAPRITFGTIRWECLFGTNGQPSQDSASQSEAPP